MKSPRDIRKARLVLIEGIVKEIKEQLGIPGVEVYPVRREFGYSVESSDNRKTGYGVGFVSFFRGTERRLVEIDCTDDGTSLDPPLVVETFDDETLSKAAPVIERFRFSQEMKELFGNAEFKHYGQHVSYFDQMVEGCKKSLDNMLKNQC